jgi:hypothetical protein
LGWLIASEHTVAKVQEETEYLATWKGETDHMNTTRRLLTGTVLIAMSSALASATTIGGITSSGCTAVMGGYDCYVTESASVTGLNFNVVSPASLFTFDNAGNLGITDLTGASFDYQLDNDITYFSITNNDTVNPTSVDVKVQTQPLLDAASTMASKTQVKNGLLIGTTTTNGPIYTVADTGNQTLAPGGSYTYPGTPSTPYTTGISYNNSSYFGDPNNDLTLNPATYSGSGTFTIGTTDQAAYSVTNTGNVGSANLTVVFTALYDAEAEVTYDYFTTTTGTPEPTTMALIGTALFGLGLVRKRLTR